MRTFVQTLQTKILFFLFVFYTKFLWIWNDFLNFCKDTITEMLPLRMAQHVEQWFVYCLCFGSIHVKHPSFVGSSTSTQSKTKQIYAKKKIFVFVRESLDFFLSTRNCSWHVVWKYNSGMQYYLSRPCWEPLEEICFSTAWDNKKMLYCRKIQSKPDFREGLFFSNFVVENNIIFLQQQQKNINAKKATNISQDPNISRQCWWNRSTFQVCGGNS